MDAIRVLYLSRNLSINGRDALAGREFLGQLKAEGWDVELRHQVLSAERISVADPQIAVDLITLEEIESFAPDCIFAEQGLLAAGEAELRVPRSWLSEYVRRGGVLVVEGLSRGTLQSPSSGPGREEQDEMLRLLLSDVSRPGSPSMPYIRDDFSNDGHPANLVCRPSEMVLSDWLRPVYDGIDRIVVGSPVPLAFSGELLATTELSASVLSMDVFDQSVGPYLWGKVIPDGVGYMAVVTGSVVHDYWVAENPDNARWMQNVIVNLVDAARREVFLRGGRPAARVVAAKPAEAAASSVSLFVLISQPENERLEFKETARVDVEANKVEEHITHSVLKTIAAFINTGGGTLLIGVSDRERTPVGVARDVATLSTRPSLDGLQLWLNQQIKQSMSEVAASLVRIGFEHLAGADICRVEVTAGKQLVPLTAKKGKDKHGNVLRDDRVLYVRLGAQTVVLPAAEVQAWLDQHRSS